jgi:acetolactate synthase-1/2/3 large subunit
MKAGQAVIEALRAEGVECIFGIVGWTTSSIVTELYGRSDIRFIDTRHEEGAAFMAYGYARASDRPAVCLTTSGAGSINLLTGISLAYKGRAPVVVLVGDVESKHIGRDGHQEFDLVSLFQPVTCMARQVNQTYRVRLTTPSTKAPLVHLGLTSPACYRWGAEVRHGFSYHTRHETCADARRRRGVGAQLP